MGASVVRCIRAAQRHGPVVIVTESDERWVRGTAELLLPSDAAACLQSVEVVSSRARFGKDFPGSPACWQIAAFSYVTNRHLLSSAAWDGIGFGGGGPTTPLDSKASAHSKNSSACSSTIGCGRRDVDWEDCRTAEECSRGSCVGNGMRNGSVVDGTGNRSLRNAGRRELRGGACPSTREGGLGTLVAVSTSPRAWEDKSAARTLREHHPQINAKTVSLLKSPSPKELRSQLDLLSDNFELMFGHRTRQESDGVHADPGISSSRTESLVTPPHNRYVHRDVATVGGAGAERKSGREDRCDFDEADHLTASPSERSEEALPIDGDVENEREIERGE